MPGKRLRQFARGLRMQAAQAGVRRPGGEQREHIGGIAQQPARHARGQVTATALEIAVDRFRPARSPSKCSSKRCSRRSLIRRTIAALR
jgi:hypothetical protein